MIKINNEEYNLINFKHHDVENVQHLHVIIHGSLKCDDLKVSISHKNKHYFGQKVLTTSRDGFSEILVYLYPEV